MGFGDDNCKHVWAPFGLSITTSLITSLLTLITVPGNLLICLAIIKDPNKELRTSFNYLLFNVAISDLLIGAVTDPIFTYFHIREALEYEVITWYALPHMSFFIGCTASLFSIAMLAVERCIAVKASYHRKLSRTRAMKMSVAIWAFSLTFPCIYFQIGYFKFAFIFAILMIIVTFVTMVTSFLRIHGNMRVMIAQPTGSANEKTSQLLVKRVERERRVTRIFTAILLFYTACNLPAFVFIFLVNLCSSCSCVVIQWSRDLLLVCVLVNSAGNQFFYSWRTKSFTRAFRSLVHLPQTDEASVIQTPNAPNVVQ